MNTEQILKVLKNERECIARQGDINKCKRHEHEGCLKCDLCLPDDEILEVYDHLIKIIENEAIQIADVSEEDKAKIVQSLSSAGYNISPELAEKYLGVVDEFSRDYFKGICPYTNEKCDKWTCSVCEVEQRERRFAEGDNGTKKCVDCEHALYLTKRDEELGIVGGCEIGFPCNEDSEGTD